MGTECPGLIAIDKREITAKGGLALKTPKKGREKGTHHDDNACCHQKNIAPKHAASIYVRHVGGTLTPPSFKGKVNLVGWP